MKTSGTDSSHASGMSKSSGTEGSSAGLSSSEGLVISGSLGSSEFGSVSSEAGKVGTSLGKLGSSSAPGSQDGLHALGMSESSGMEVSSSSDSSEFLGMSSTTSGVKGSKSSKSDGFHASGMSSSSGAETSVVVD